MAVILHVCLTSLRIPRPMSLIDPFPKLDHHRDPFGFSWVFFEHSVLAAFGHRPGFSSTGILLAVLRNGSRIVSLLDKVYRSIATINLWDAGTTFSILSKDNHAIGERIASFPDSAFSVSRGVSSSTLSAANLMTLRSASNWSISSAQGIPS